jgi:hypothetical protein
MSRILSTCAVVTALGAACSPLGRAPAFGDRWWRVPSPTDASSQRGWVPEGLTGTPVPAALPSTVLAAGRNAPARAVWIVDPYANQGSWWKGQTHGRSVRDDGWVDPAGVLSIYRSHGYAFVGLTDRYEVVDTLRDPWRQAGGCDAVNADPSGGRSGLAYVPSNEVGRRGGPHLLYLGVPREGCSPSWCKGLCRLPGRDRRRMGDLAWYVRWIDERGGMAVASRPWNLDDGWNEEWLASVPWLRGIEIAEPAGRAAWDRALRKDVARWGIAADDGAPDATGFVVANAATPGRGDLLAALRAGSFYGVRLAVAHDPSPPEFLRIDTGPDGTIVACVRNASAARAVTAAGKEPLEILGPLALEHSDHDHVRFQADGSEGYVRLEIANRTGTVAYAQPLFVGGASRERVVPIDPARVGVSLQGPGRWAATDGAAFEVVVATREDAYRVSDLVRALGANGLGRVGALQYFTVDGAAPAGELPSEDCAPFDPTSLTVELQGNRWDAGASDDPMLPYQAFTVRDATRRLLAFGDSEVQARRAVEIIGRYGFDRQCFVGRGRGQAVPGFVYFRRTATAPPAEIHPARLDAAPQR